MANEILYTLEFKEAGAAVASKRRLAKRLEKQGEHSTEHLTLNLEKHILEIRGVEESIFEDIINDYGPSIESQQIKQEKPDFEIKGVEDSLKKAQTAMQEYYEGRLKELQNENDDALEMLEEQEKTNERLKNNIRTLEQRIEHIHTEQETAAPIRTCRKLLDALKEDYEVLDELGLEKEDFVKLQEVNDEQEYLESRTGTELSEGVNLEVLRTLPDRFEQTSEYVDFKNKDIGKKQEIVRYLDSQAEKESEIPEIIKIQLGEEQARKDVEEYEQVKKEFEEKKRIREDLESLTGTYDDFVKLKERVEYREEKQEKITCMLADRKEDQERLTVSMVVCLNKQDRDEFSKDLTEYLARALDINPSDLGRHTRYQDKEKIISKKYSLKNRDREDILSNIRQKLGQSKEDYLFSSLGVNIELVYKSLI